MPTEKKKTNNGGNMKVAILIALCTGLAVLGFAVAQAGEGIIEDGAKLGDELVVNGDFEKGKDSPDGWEEVDETKDQDHRSEV
jgi:hypothetical protein